MRGGLASGKTPRVPACGLPHTSTHFGGGVLWAVTTNCNFGTSDVETQTSASTQTYEPAHLIFTAPPCTCTGSTLRIVHKGKTRHKKSTQRAFDALCMPPVPSSFMCTFFEKEKKCRRQSHRRSTIKSAKMNQNRRMPPRQTPPPPFQRGQHLLWALGHRKRMCSCPSSSPSHDNSTANNVRRTGDGLRSIVDRQPLANPLTPSVRHPHTPVAGTSCSWGSTIPWARGNGCPSSPPHYCKSASRTWRATARTASRAAPRPIMANP